MIAPVSLPLVCHVNLASGFRGGERQTELLIDSLGGAGFRQRLVARRGGQLARRLASADGVDVRPVASNVFAAALATRGADVVHAHEGRAVHAAWLQRLVAGTPYLLTRRVDNAFARSPLRDRAYARASRLVAVSRAIAALVDERYGDGRSVVVPDAHAGLATGHTTPPALAARFVGKTVIGHIGALDHSHKGQRTLLEVARMAAETHPGWHFVLVGDGRDEAELHKLADGLGNVEFTGFVDNVADWLSVFDLFVFPSLHEGLGSILLDAMSFGLPIVASRVGGIPDIVEDGRNGVLLAPETPRSWFDTMGELLADEERRAAMRRANLETAEQYSAAHMAANYAGLYRSILSEASA